MTSWSLVFFIGFLFPIFISFFGKLGGGGGGCLEKRSAGLAVKFSQVETARRDEWESHRDPSDFSGFFQPASLLGFPSRV